MRFHGTGVDRDATVLERLLRVHADAVGVQIIGMIKEQQAGMPTAEVCSRRGLSTATFYKLKAKYGGMDVSEAGRLKALEDENAKLTRLLEDTIPLRPSGLGIGVPPVSWTVMGLEIPALQRRSFRS
tara:strand:- start:192 stop:572 length:381 start_codon:yes stop_codon:yes gene_type:complete